VIKETFALATAIFICASTIAPSEARGSGGRGRGAAGWRTASGAGWKAGGGGIVGRNAGLVGGAFKGKGLNGGTGQGAGIAGWKKGTGAFEHTKMNLHGAGGSTYNGFTNGKYNAKTGTGSYNASHQAYDAKNGQTYGDTNTTTYSNGKGVTQFDTDHHGDYTIDWNKGQKPSVTKDAGTQK
jgi:hypothetical protein